MNKQLRISFWAVMSAGLAFAGGHAPSFAATLGGFTVDTQSREEVRNFYNGIYPASVAVDIGWTGDYLTGDEGDVSQTFEDASLLRINFFRALAGVPANVTLRNDWSAKAQKAALMMSMKGQLSHYPGGGIDSPLDTPELWPAWSQDGFDAAGSANLFLGSTSLDPIRGAIDGYIADYGGGNERVGHRRWFFYPQTPVMGIGHVPGDDSLLTPGVLPPNEPFTLRQANAVWVVDEETFFDPRPAVRDGFVAWPPPGFTPYQLVYPRWSLSYPSADFTDASVAVTIGGAPLNITVEDRNTPNTGENTIVWRHPDWPDFQPAPKPSADVVYQVSVTNVKVGNSTTNFSYTVSMFDPATPGPDTVIPSLTGPSEPLVGKNNAYTVAGPATATTYDLRAFERVSYQLQDGAESGLGNWLATLPAGFSGISTNLRASGTSSFWFGHLFNPVNPAPKDAVLQLPTTLLVGTNTPVRFSSRHGKGLDTQIARFQASIDGGVTWKDHWTSVGSATAELRFSTALPDLSEYVGKHINIRFIYTIGHGQFRPATQIDVGWFVDDISIAGVDELKNEVVTTVAGTGPITFVPDSTNSVTLQARARIYNDYPLEWGSLLNVDPIVPAPLVSATITRITIASPNQFFIEFDGGTGVGLTHRIQSSNTLEGGWETETTHIQALGQGKFHAEVTGVGATRKFFRVATF